MQAPQLTPQDLIRQLDQLASRFGQAAHHYDQAAVLQRKTADQLLDRCALLREPPAVTVDVGCGTGYALPKLAKLFPNTELHGVDLSPEMLEMVKARCEREHVQAQLHYADAHHLPFDTDSIDLVFSNLMAQWSPNLEQLWLELHRVLRPGGCLMLTTYGPDTLDELRSSWAQIDGHQHVNQFIDMHTVGDQLRSTGFLDPVMDRSLSTLTYARVMDVCRDLKAVGANTVLAPAGRGLTTPTRFSRLCHAYQAYHTEDGKIPASFEVIFAHAWAGESVSRNQDGVSEIPVSTIRVVRREA